MGLLLFSWNFSVIGLIVILYIGYHILLLAITDAYYKYRWYIYLILILLYGLSYYFFDWLVFAIIMSLGATFTLWLTIKMFIDETESVQKIESNKSKPNAEQQVQSNKNDKKTDSTTESVANTIEDIFDSFFGD